MEGDEFSASVDIIYTFTFAAKKTAPSLFTKKKTK
jgi:hypothetical protein